MKDVFEKLARFYDCDLARFKAEYALVGYTGARSGEHFHVQVSRSSRDGELVANFYNDDVANIVF